MGYYQAKSELETEINEDNLRCMQARLEEERLSESENVGVDNLESQGASELVTPEQC